LQVRGNDLRNCGCSVAVIGPGTDEFRYGNRHRLEIAALNIDHHGRRITRRQGQTSGDRAKRERTAARENRHGSILRCHDIGLA
jgi:hypothetical protein